MAASVGANGVTTTTKNVFIPLEMAQIGDAVLIQNNTDGSSVTHFKAVLGRTVQATPPAGYTWYGVVYGRERRGLMIRGLRTSSQKWATTTATNEVVNIAGTPEMKDVVDTTPTDGYGLGRNGLKTTYPPMSVSKVVNDMKNNDSGSTALHFVCGGPASWTWTTAARPMNITAFNADTNKAKTIYGTYENYIAQALPNLKTGPFKFRCGKQNTKVLATNTSVDGYSFPAAQYCYNFKVAQEAANHWWLPDMYELYMMMCDNSFNTCKGVCSVLGDNSAVSAYRWSCVRYSATNAWYFSGYGVAYDDNFVHGLLAVPVTLLNL